MLRGKCRYCKKPVSWQYPTVELATGILFIISYVFWPYSYDVWGIVGLVSWLILIVGFMALTVYDLRWMLLPNKILFPLYGVGTIFAGSLLLMEPKLSVLLEIFAGIIVGGGVFYLLFQVSAGKWIGGGDVKLGFLLGALAGTGYKAMMILFLASLFGCMYILPMALSGKATAKLRIPFGPFLIFACFVVVLFGSKMIDFYLDWLVLS
jgi:prepilin signal peptidase PulO-like enzyme (type II secretory pathway)